MSAPRTPTKSAGSKGDEAKTPRPVGSAASGTPPTGGAQRRHLQEHGRNSIQQRINKLWQV